MSNGRELRQMKKSKATKTKQSLGRTSAPLSREGNAGDIRVRQTDQGPKMEAKIGNEWFKVDMTPVNSAVSIIIPKVYFIKGQTGSIDPGGGIEYFLPEGINNNNIIAVVFGVSLGGNERTYFSLGGNVSSGESTASSSAGGPTGKQYNMFVHYNKRKNAVRIEILTLGTSVENKEFTLSVFYK